MELNPQGKLKVGVLNLPHPSYDAERDADLWAMYKGGRAVTAKRFLLKRRAEGDLYEERCRRFYYLGYIGEICDHLASRLMMNRPTVTVGDDRASLPEYWKAWTDDVDQGGTDLMGFMRDRVLRGLVQRRAFTWVDLPPLPAEEARPATMRDAEQAGLNDPYLIPINRNQVMDYQLDDRGRLLWVTLRQVTDARPNPFGESRERVYDWTTLTTTDFARYRAREDPKHEGGAWKGLAEKDLAEREAELLSNGKHRFEGQVPLLPLDVPEGLHVGEKLEGVQKQTTEMATA